MQNLFEEDKGEMLSANIALIQVEIKALYSALLQLLPDVETLQNEINSAETFLSPSEDYQQSIPQQLLAELKLACTHVSQVKIKVTGVMEDIKVLLTQRDSTATANNKLSSPVTAGFKVDNSDDSGDLDRCEEISQVQSPSGDRDSSEETSQVPSPSGDLDSCEETSQVPSPSGDLDSSEETSQVPSPASVTLVEMSGEEKEPAKDLYESPTICTSQETQTPIVSTGKCHICGMNILSRSYHMQKYHPGKKYISCKTCGQTFDEVKEFRKHQYAHKTSLLLKCDLCNKRLTTQK
ncbi:zinc finger protein 480, partial [Elysia marginata]